LPNILNAARNVEIDRADSYCDKGSDQTVFRQVLTVGFAENPEYYTKLIPQLSPTWVLG
jgi:hypothetical protein